MEKQPWIRFEDTGPSKSGLTREWDICPLDGNCITVLGTIKWYGSWRKYCLCTIDNVVFEKDCLRTIADFCEAKTKEHLAKRKSTKRFIAIGEHG